MLDPTQALTEKPTDSPDSVANSPHPYTEDQILSAMATTLGGVAHPGDEERALAIYLTMIAQLDGHTDEGLMQEMSREVASLATGSLPTEDGVSLSLELPEATDLAFTNGLAGYGGYARELVMRARFAANSAKRIARAWRQDGKEGRQAQMKKERVYFQAHKRVAKHREDHLGLIDEATRRFGDTLSWRSVMDERTTHECRAAHNKNFHVSNPPAIGLPGTVHPLCRCSVGPPNPGGDFV